MRMNKYGRSRHEIAIDNKHTYDQLAEKKPDPIASEIFNNPAYHQSMDAAKYIKQQRDKMPKDGTGRIPRWKSGEEVFLRWMEDKNVEGQMSLADYEGVVPEWE